MSVREKCYPEIRGAQEGALHQKMRRWLYEPDNDEYNTGDICHPTTPFYNTNITIPFGKDGRNYNKWTSCWNTMPRIYRIFRCDNISPGLWRFNKRMSSLQINRYSLILQKEAFTSFQPIKWSSLGTPHNMKIDPACLFKES